MGLHDVAFKKLLKHPGAARALLFKYLPPALSRLMVGHPRLMSEASQSKHRKARFADAVLHVRLKGHARLEVFVIPEHKSRRDGRLSRQLLDYMHGVVTWRRQGNRLALTVALVVYTGNAPWPGPHRYSDAIDAPPELKATGMDFPIHVVDVGRKAIDELPEEPAVRGGLLALKVASDRTNLEADVWAMLENLRREPEVREFFMGYLSEVLRGADWKAFNAVVKRYQQEKEPPMKSVADVYREKFQKQFTREGLKTARRQDLQQVLEARFERVPKTVAAKVAKAGEKSLEKWFAAALKAKTLEAVFEAQ